MGKRRGMVAGRKLKQIWIMQRWAEKQYKKYKKFHIGNEWKKPYTISPPYKSAIRKCAKVQIILFKENKEKPRS